MLNWVDASPADSDTIYCPNHGSVGPEHDVEYCMGGEW